MILNPVVVQSGIKLPELTNPGTAADLLLGKQLIDAQGNKLAGMMPITNHQNPTISVGTYGLITASHNQSKGYTDGGSAKQTRQILAQIATIPMSIENISVASNGDVTFNLTGFQNYV